MVYGICALTGIIFSVVCTLLFFQSDKTWIRMISPLIGISGMGITYTLIQKLIGENSKDIIQNGMVVFLGCIVIMSPVTLFIMCKALKDKNGQQVIRIRDILLGQKKFIDTYYEQRSEELKEAFYSKMIDEEKKKIALEKDEIQERIRNIESREKKFREQAEHSVSMQLPIESPVPMTNEFLGQFPDFIEGLAKYINDVRQLTKDYIIRYEENNRYILLHSYFLGLCSFTMKDVFDTSSQNVRVHFRILKGDNYVKFVAKIGENIYEDDLTPMPKNKGMIKQSYNTQTSLIKSLNITYDEKGNHRKVWEDYMTITFYDICKDGEPFLSMGISVKNKEKFKHLLYFLNFYKIENFLQDQLREIDKVYNIVETIEENFS